LSCHSIGEDDWCHQVALLVAAFIAMLTKVVATRATTATRAGCFPHWVGRETPCLRGGSSPAAEDEVRPRILQLNPEEFTASKENQLTTRLDNLFQTRVLPFHGRICFEINAVISNICLLLSIFSLHLFLPTHVIYTLRMFFLFRRSLVQSEYQS